MYFRGKVIFDCLENFQNTRDEFKPLAHSVPALNVKVCPVSEQMQLNARSFLIPQREIKCRENNYTHNARECLL